jgi:hypothetical protein
MGRRRLPRRISVVFTSRWRSAARVAGVLFIVAGQWDRVRDELFGDRVHLAALAALADGDWIAGDLGCGPVR